MRTIVQSVLFVSALAVAAVLPVPLAAQVPASEAAAFIGDWTIAVEGEMPATFTVRIMDEGGQVAAVVTGIEGTDYTVRRITKPAESLVLGYDSSMQGQQVPITITLTPAGADLDATVDLAGGMLTLPGKATRRG